MLRHNLVIILRGLSRFKRTFVINLVGLSVGLASALLIFLWVNDELSVDKFHEKDERLYQVMTTLQENTIVDTPGLLAQALAEEMPEIEYAAAVAPPNWRGFDGFILTADKQNIKATGEYAGKDYFNIFSYGLIQGDAGQVLADAGARLWLHGHTHSPRDYVIGTTRVVCNPRGYPHEKWKPPVDLGLAIELPPAAVA